MTSQTVPAELATHAQVQQSVNVKGFFSAVISVLVSSFIALVPALVVRADIFPSGED
jgi:hypothetical protein